MTYLFMRDIILGRRRTGAVVGLLAIVMTLLFVMNGLVNQFNVEPKLATASIGGDRYWTVSEASTGPITSPITDAQLASVDGVPVTLGMTSLDGARALVVGRQSLAEVTDRVVGRWATSSGELVVDASTGLTVGDQTLLGGRVVSVVGVIDDGTVLAGVPLVFTTLDQATSVLASGTQDALVGVLTDAPPGLPLPPGTKVLTSEEVAADAFLPLSNAVSTVTLVNSLLWVIAIIVTAAVTYLSAIERTREFAVLKAIGASSRAVGLSQLLQGMLTALLAAAVAAVLQQFVAPLFPMTVRVPDAAFVRIPALAAAVALVAGAAGTRHAIRVQPSEAFS